MQAFLALSPKDAQRFGAPCLEVVPRDLCRRPWVPLRLSRELAIKAALEANFAAAAATAATEPTAWCMVVVTLTDSEIAELFRTGVLCGINQTTGVQWWGTLSHNGIGKLEMELVELAPIGLGAWAYTALEKQRRYKGKRQGECVECAAAGVPVWTSSRHFGKEDYCAGCWNSFIRTALSEKPSPESNAPNGNQ